jgi:predicted secreted hydrolase
VTAPAGRRGPRAHSTAGTALAVVTLAIALGALMSRRAEQPATDGTGETAAIGLADALGGADPGGFARADTPRAFRFPADHGPHPEYRTEWWYLTGNVRTATGRRFGYQITFFRSALAADPPAGSSPWRAHQAYMAHLALADVEAGRFHAFERFARGAAGLAGARAEPLRVWLEDWRLERVPAAGPALRGAAPPLTGPIDAAHPPLRLRAADGDIALDLLLEPVKPPVFHGDAGLSRKGPEPGNASRYYSWTRVRTSGVLVVDGERQRVEGTSWLDREWGTTALSPGLAGWDWFALQMEDGSELMLYRMRREDGSADPFSGGSYVPASGPSLPLRAEDAAVTVTAHWTSGRTGARYPSAWRISVPAIRLDAEVRPVLADQEMPLSVRYWEGAVTVTGRKAGQPVSGAGYVELTGYDAAARRRMR